MALTPFPGTSTSGKPSTTLTPFPTGQSSVPREMPATPAIPGLLGNTTTISQAPPKTWPLGFVGRAAKAAFDVTKQSIGNAAEKVLEAFNASDASGVNLKTSEQAPGFSKYTADGKPNPNFQKEIKAREDFIASAPKETVLTRSTKTGQAGLSFVNLYPPIAIFNAELAAAKQLPGPLSAPAKAVDFAFQKVGELGARGLDAGIDELTKTGVISQETSDKIKPFAEDLASFATLIVGTHYGFKAMEKGLGGALDRVPISDAAKARVNKGVQLAVGFSMQPFTTAYGLTSSLVATKIHERQLAGVEITPKEGIKIMEEVKKELPSELTGRNENPVIEPETTIKPFPESKQASEIDRGKAIAPKDVVTINDAQFQLRGRSLSDYKEAKAKYDERVAQLKKQVAEGSPSASEFAAKRLKEEGMKFSALKRELTGNLTATEIANKIKTEESNYRGKSVLVEVNGKEARGTIDSAPSFGRYKVRLDDGTVISKLAGDIKDPRTSAQIKNQVLHRPEARVYQPPKLKEVKEPVEVPKRKPKAPDSNRPPTKPNEFTSRVFERLQAERPDVLKGDLTVEHRKLQEDLDRAVKLIETDKQKAFDIAMGKEEATDTSATSISIALAEKALADGDYELYNRLTRARSLDLTRKGFDIAAERGSVTDNSTSKYVKELLATRLEKLGKEYLSDIKNKFKRTSDKGKALDVIDREVKKVEEKIKTKKLDVKDALSLLDKLSCL